jgi:hypothetical protein
MVSKTLHEPAQRCNTCDEKSRINIVITMHHCACCNHLCQRLDCDHFHDDEFTKVLMTMAIKRTFLTKIADRKCGTPA